MKQFILILLLIFTFLSCSEDNKDESCDTDYQCSDNHVCVHGRCIEDYCTKYNYACGTGECYVRDINFAQCRCPDEHYYLSYDPDDPYNKIKPCYEVYTCKDSSDCARVKQWSTDEHGYFRVCTKDNICAIYCEDNSDCIGENEVCVYNNSCSEYPKENECDESHYNDRYNNLNCVHECDENFTCKAGFTCKNKQCVPRCLTNEDCLEDKFTGDTCDNSLKICID